jgi:hypothetical protein
MAREAEHRGLISNVQQFGAHLRAYLGYDITSVCEARCKSVNSEDRDLELYTRELSRVSNSS